MLKIALFSSKNANVAKTLGETLSIIFLLKVDHEVRKCYVGLSGLAALCALGKLVCQSAIRGTKAGFEFLIIKNDHF